MSSDEGMREWAVEITAPLEWTNTPKSEFPALHADWVQEFGGKILAKPIPFEQKKKFWWNEVLYENPPEGARCLVCIMWGPDDVEAIFRDGAYYPVDGSGPIAPAVLNCEPVILE